MAALDQLLAMLGGSSGDALARLLLPAGGDPVTGPSNPRLPQWDTPQGLIGMDPRIYGYRMPESEVVARLLQRGGEDLLLPTNRPPFANVTPQADPGNRALLANQPYTDLVRGLDQDLTGTGQELTALDLMRMLGAR